MKLKSLFFIVQCLLSISVYTQSTDLQFKAKRTERPPKIDGILEDSWQMSDVFSDFTQYDPRQGAQPRFQTKVYFLYDDEAIYIGARMYDTAPDSILVQLGNRDTDLNADDIVFQFDPFGTKLDAYYFRVTASNVQSDWRKKDASYNAVWQSKTTIDDEGWTVEVKIPFSTLRIPSVDDHQWSFQVTRNIRRIREFSKLAPETKGVDNDMIFWGNLQGITNIRPPVRLSLTPYFSIFAEIDPKQQGQKRKTSITPIGGLDLKYGINESFTFDLTLLPDFSQVKSDDVIKNLSAFEINFSEQRPFFLETMDLFKLGNLFYSRRIGKFPSKYYDASGEANENEEIISNPASVSLINSFKLTGQTGKGLSIGILNAITDVTFAEIRDSSGHVRRFQTEPLSNYNVIALQQALPNNSSFYLINTNVLRSGSDPTANVTGGGLKLYSGSNKYLININGSTNSHFNTLSDIALNKAGYSWNGMIAKVRGNFQFHYYHQMKNARYNINDMGISYTNDETHHEIQTAYKIFNPFWKLLRLNTGLNIWRSHRISTGKPTSTGIDLSVSTTTVKHLSAWTDIIFSPGKKYDYYEPRTPGYFYISPYSYSLNLGFSSDYRKPFALDGKINQSAIPSINNSDFAIRLTPIIRVNNHLQFSMSGMYGMDSNSRGFAGRDSTGVPVFGKRDVLTAESSFSGKYIFVNNLSLSLRVRHYWARGIYDDFFLLNNEGNLAQAPENLAFENFNFNSFLVDLVFNWEFAPGSNLTLVWKNSIIDEQNYIIRGYLDNLASTLEYPQSNLFSLKFI